MSMKQGRMPAAIEIIYWQGKLQGKLVEQKSFQERQMES